MTDSDFDAKIKGRRENFEEFGRIIDGLNEDVGFTPSRDTAFWRDFDRIEVAGKIRNEAEVPWLASLTQVDDLGPMGRAMFLAFAALDALCLMPAATLVEGKKLTANLSPDASKYRKVGVCKVLEASASEEALPLLEALAQDPSPYVQSEGAWCLKQLREKIEQKQP